MNEGKSGRRDVLLLAVTSRYLTGLTVGAGRRGIDPTLSIRLSGVTPTHGRLSGVYAFPEPPA